MMKKTDEGFELVSVADFLRDVPLRSAEYDLDESQAEVDRPTAEVARLREALEDAEARGIRTAAEAIWHDPIARLLKVAARQAVANHLLALIPYRDNPRRASGPIDPAHGFATTGAEARWIADTDAGVYDDRAQAYVKHGLREDDLP